MKFEIPPMPDDTSKMLKVLESVFFDISDKRIKKLEYFLRGIFEAYAACKIELDEDFVKIPRCYFDELWIKYYKEYANPPSEKEKKRGRNPIKRLFRNISDSKVVNYFKQTLSAAKEACEIYYEDLKQFCICFYQGAFNAFSPYEDPYGKLSHYHNLLSSEFDDIPSRKTLNNWYNWYKTWRRTAMASLKEQAEAARHKIWTLLIKWIYGYLQQLAPEYVVAQ